MKVIIPAAGEGRRLRPHTSITPKVLLWVAGKPILGHIFDRLSRIEPEEVVVITGAMGEMVERYLKENYQIPLRFVAQGSPEGLGHAVWMGLKDRPSGPLLILLGDTILDLPKLKGGDDEGLLGVKPVSDPRRFGVVELRGDRVLRIVEKPEAPRSNLALLGLYYLPDGVPLLWALESLIRDKVRTRGEYQLTDALQRLIEEGATFRAFEVENWLDCGTPQALLYANRQLLPTSAYHRPRDGVVVVPPVYIADSAIIEHSIIGPSVSIAEGAEIRDSILKGSIVNRSARIEGAVVVNSLIGESSLVHGLLEGWNLGPFSEVGSL